jgi:cohesin domain-containing protein
MSEIHSGRRVSVGLRICLLMPWVMYSLSAIAQVSLEVGSDEAACGEALDIPITVSGATDLDAFGMVLHYDSTKLSYVSTTAGTATTDWAAVSGNETTPGQVTIGGFKGAGTAVSGTGELVVVTLTCDVCPSSSDLTLSDLVDDVAGAPTTPGTATCSDAPYGLCVPFFADHAPVEEVFPPTSGIASFIGIQNLSPEEITLTINYRTIDGLVDASPADNTYRLGGFAGVG